MKTKNFPEKKRQRQIRALARLQAQLADLPKGEPKKRFYPIEHEITVLQTRTAQNMRGARTKKRRVL